MWFFEGNLCEGKMWLSNMNLVIVLIVFCVFFLVFFIIYKIFINIFLSYIIMISVILIYWFILFVE